MNFYIWDNMLDLNRSLDLILEEAPTVERVSIADAVEIVQQLQDARQLVADLEHRLSSTKQKLSSELALNLRRTKPSLNISLDKVGCKVGYKTKCMTFVPDLESGIWRVASPNERFLKEFLRSHSRDLLLDNSSILIDVIVDYFTNYYRTLGETIEGTGKLLVESKNATLFDLVNWRKSTIKSRLSRMVC